MRRRWRFWGLRFLLFGALAIVVFSSIVMGLWNWLMPALFGLRQIGILEAFGLLVLSRILFGGFHRGGGGGNWRRRMKDRWDRMTPEEREQFRGFMQRQCGRPPVQTPPVQAQV